MCCSCPWRDTFVSKKYRVFLKECTFYVSKFYDPKTLDRHYNRSDVVITLLTNLHTQAGPIPDPKLEPRSCHKVLAVHSEILSGMVEFIKSSDCPDRFNNL